MLTEKDLKKIEGMTVSGVPDPHTITLDNVRHVRINNEFASALNSFISKADFWARTVEIEGLQYMKEDSFNAYVQLSKSLNRIKT